MIHKPRLFRVAAFFLLLFLATAVSATTYNVGSITDLNTRIASAVAGDVIIVSNGVYTTSSAITVNRTGTAGNPITIQAQTVGGVEITGTHGINMGSSATYITVQGFKFTQANGISIPHGCTHCRYTRNLIQLTIPSGSDVSYFNISADDVELDRNELRNKSTLGEMLDISGSGSQVARRLWVHHNYFHDFTSPGGNGAETIRWGLSGLSLSTGNGLCEYNLFVRCNGENEMISNKSSGNTYRYNSVLDCPGGEISQRHGNDCLYYGNYMRNTAGMRVYGDRHKIFSNYYESNSIAVNMGNGDGDVYNGAALTAHDRPDDNIVVYNVFVNNTAHYQMGGRTGGLGSSNTVVANNIFQGGGNMASVSSSAPYTGSWSNNIRWQTSTAGNMPATGYNTVDPLLVKDANKEYHIQAGSPAINAGVGSYNYYGVFSSYPFVNVDMDGQARDGSPDIGADEFSAAPVIAKILGTNDVGPFLIEGGLQFQVGAVPPSHIVLPGNVVNYIVSVTALNGTTGVVALATTGLPSGTSAVFNPPFVTNTGSSTLTITASNSAVFGNYAVTIQGTSSNVTQTAGITLSVGDFLVSAAPAFQAVVHGSNAIYTVTLTTNTSFTGSVTFGATGLPLGGSASFSPPTLSAAGSSTLTVTTSSGDPGAIYNLAITASGGTTGSNANTSASLNVTGDVAPPGILIWNGTNNWSVAVNWTNVSLGGLGAPGAGSDVVFTNFATTVASNTVNNIVDTDTTINSLVYAQTNSFHTTLINAGRTLTILSNAAAYQSAPALNVGQDVHPSTASSVYASITGANGTLSINNTNSSIQVREGFGSGTVGTKATLDMSGLGTFNVTLRRFQIGTESGTPRRVAGVVYLARTNSITLAQALDVNTTNFSSGTPALYLGHNTQAGNTNGSVVYLGITNAVFVNHIVIGRGNQTNNLFAFNPAFLANNPFVFLRGSDGVSRVGQWTAGDNSAGSLTGPSSGTNDFTGGTVDAMVDRLHLGRGRTGTTTNTGFGTLTFDKGTIDVNSVRLGTMIDEGSSLNASGVGVANVNGSALLRVNLNLQLAHTNTVGTNILAPAAIAATRGTLNVGGGTVEATNILGAGGVAVLNLNSGTLDLEPDWATAQGIITNIATLNVGAVGVTTPAILKNAAAISTPNTLTVASNGVISGNTIINSAGLILNGTIAPGASVGHITNNGSLTLGAGGRYTLEVNDAAGGPGVGWDFVRATGAINIQATSGNPFVIDVQSLDLDQPGDIAGFNNDLTYGWVIASAGGGITGFDPAKFSIRNSGFGNDLAGGYFFVKTNSGSLLLAFTNNHPPTASTLTVVRTGNTLTIPLASLVSHWSDPDGDPVSFFSVGPDSTNGLNNVGSDASNIYYTNANPGVDAIIYSVADVRTNAPAVYRIDDTARIATGIIVVQTPVPAIGNIMTAGTDLIFSGTGGIEGENYYVLSSTNLSLPLNSWTRMATNVFGVGGNFNVTNPVAPGTPQQFYLLQLP